MENIIGAVVLGIVAIVCFVFGYLQFHEKGFLFNNAYIYASKQERETMVIFTQCIFSFAYPIKMVCQQKAYCISFFIYPNTSITFALSIAIFITSTNSSFFSSSFPFYFLS